MKSRHTPDPRFEHPSWAARYVALCKKRLDGEPLSESDEALADAVETAAHLMPGILEQALLATGLESTVPVSLAAASAPAGASCYDLVLEAQTEGKDYVAVDLGRGEERLMRIIEGEDLVELCYQDRFTFAVAGPDGVLETVGLYGGVFVSFDQLRALRLVLDIERKTILLERI